MDIGQVCERVEALRKMDPWGLAERTRLKNIMNGGVQGIMAIMAWDLGGQRYSSPSAIAKKYGTDLPTVNLMASGVERLAQMVGRAPTLKAPEAQEGDDRKKLERRIGILRGWDYEQKFELQYPQVGRWLPGYGFTMWHITVDKGSDGDLYPVAKLLDTYDLYPGWYGADQQPSEVARIRKVPIRELERAYPQANWIDIKKRLSKTRGSVPGSSFSGAVDLSLVKWEGSQSGVAVADYWCNEGWYTVIPEIQEQMGFVPNALESGPPFVFAKRFSFDRLISHYHHVIGLTGMMAKMNILGMIASEDSVFRETNIIGEPAGRYRRGRFAVNYLNQGTQIDRPTGDIPQATWAQIDRLERQLRIGAAYDVSQDAISPNSFATGQGIEKLQGSITNNVREYHTSIRWANQALDHKRFELCEAYWPSAKKRVYHMSPNNPKSTYIASRDIKGDYRSRRPFGAMATWDDNAKGILGLQYLGGKVIDLETMQENVDGLEEISLINKRNREREAESVLFQRLGMGQDQMRDPRADMTLVQIMENGSDDNARDVLKKFYTPEEPQMSPEEEQMAMAAAMGGMGGAGGGGPAGPPPSVSTLLSRVETGGEPEAGVQTASRL